MVVAILSLKLQFYNGIEFLGERGNGCVVASLLGFNPPNLNFKEGSQVTLFTSVRNTK